MLANSEWSMAASADADTSDCRRPYPKGQGNRKLCARLWLPYIFISFQKATVTLRDNLTQYTSHCCSLESIVLTLAVRAMDYFTFENIFGSSFESAGTVPRWPSQAHAVHPHQQLGPTVFASANMLPVIASTTARQSVDGSGAGPYLAFGQPPPLDTAPGRKRKAPTLKDSDWEPMKVRITQLYVEENLTVPRLREAIQTEFGFQAT